MLLRLIDKVAAALAIINFYATFIILGVTVAIIIFDDDALQKWLNRCCFSKEEKRDPFNDLTEELTEFHQAIGATI